MSAPAPAGTTRPSWRAATFRGDRALAFPGQGETGLAEIGDSEAPAGDATPWPSATRWPWNGLPGPHLHLRDLSPGGNQVNGNYTDALGDRRPVQPRQLRRPADQRRRRAGGDQRGTASRAGLCSNTGLGYAVSRRSAFGSRG